MYNSRLVLVRLANIFGNGTIYRHDKKTEKGKNPRNTPNKPSAEGANELWNAEGTSLQIVFTIRGRLRMAILKYSTLNKGKRKGKTI